MANYRRHPAIASSDEKGQVCRRLMTVPGVGAVMVLAFKTAVGEPARFQSSAALGAYFGLTPSKYASGETDYTGHITKCGDNRSSHANASRCPVDAGASRGRQPARALARGHGDRPEDPPARLAQEVAALHLAHRAEVSGTPTASLFLPGRRPIHEQIGQTQPVRLPAVEERAPGALELSPPMAARTFYRTTARPFSTCQRTISRRANPEGPELLLPCHRPVPQHLRKPKSLRLASIEDRFHNVGRQAGDTLLLCEVGGFLSRKLDLVVSQGTVHQ
jgi:hypothetical protein